MLPTLSATVALPRLLFLLVLPLLFVLVGACAGNSDSAALGTPEATAPIFAEIATQVPPTPTLLPEPTQAPSPTPESEPTQAPPPAFVVPPPTRVPAPPQQSGVAAPIRGYGFPFELSVAAGATVVWTNHDIVPHDVTASDGSWASPVIEQGQTFRHTFTQPGRYGYVCKVHPYMAAVVIVR